MKKSCSKSFGFTLAEVLITLGIIGIVAEITIPTLYQSVSNQYYTNQLKKAYSTFNQALISLTTDYGCIGDLACTGLFNTGRSVQDFGDEIAKYFKVTQNCGLNASQGCWSHSVAPNYDGSGTRADVDAASGRYKFVTADGATYYIVSYANDCTTNRGYNSMSAVCAWLWVDVNGVKGPNNHGRDIYQFWVTNGKGPLLYPYGGKDHFAGTSSYWKDVNACVPTNTSGDYCTGRVMEESWQMNY